MTVSPCCVFKIKTNVQTRFSGEEDEPNFTNIIVQRIFIRLNYGNNLTKNKVMHC